MQEKDKILIMNSKNGDEKSLTELITQNNGLIWSVVRKFWYKEIEVDDLYQIACIGFIKAVRRFDFKYNVELSTYAVQYIYGEIKKFIRDDGIIKISRNIKELSSKIRALKKHYGDNLKITQIAKMLNVSEEDVKIALDATKKVESTNQYFYENGNCEIQEKIVIQNNEENIIDKILVSNLMENLKVRDKEIIELRYFSEKTQAQVANIIGISQVQVSRIERKALNKMKSELIRGEFTY